MHTVISQLSPELSTYECSSQELFSTYEHSREGKLGFILLFVQDIYCMVLQDSEGQPWQ